MENTARKAALKLEDRVNQINLKTGYVRSMVDTLKEFHEDIMRIEDKPKLSRATYTLFRLDNSDERINNLFNATSEMTKDLSSELDELVDMILAMTEEGQPEETEQPHKGEWSNSKGKLIDNKKAPAKSFERIS